VIPSSQLREGHELVGGILFQTLFGEVLGRRILSTIIAISSASTLLVVIFSDARMIQGISREGFLPFSKALASNFPFGTPLGALILNVCISASVLFLPKTGDLYNYVISMQIYPNQLFHAVLCVGVYKARNRFPQLKAPIRASHVSIIFCFISSVAVFIAPLSSPKSLLTSYSFGGLLMFFVFSIYWFVVVKLMPWYGGYMIYRRTVRLNHDGMKVKKWEYAYN
jgi:L-asparagine transporter-like permease